MECRGDEHHYVLNKYFYDIFHNREVSSWCSQNTQISFLIENTEKKNFESRRIMHWVNEKKTLITLLQGTMN